VAESAFTWLASNIDFAACHGQPPMLPPSDNLERDALVDVGGLRIGIFALLLPFDAEEAQQQPEIRPAIETARQMSRALRARGAEVVIALTHLPVAEDLALNDVLGADGPDLVIGGHDHTAMAVPAAAPRVFKADADAVTANVFTIRLDGAGKPVIAVRRETLDAAVPKDPTVARDVAGWLRRHAHDFCSAKGKPDDCLERVVGRTRTPIEAEELANRTRETGIGDWIADRMLAARPSADVALLNSGTLRLNYDLPAGTVLKRRHIEELFGFKSPLVVVETTGAALWRAAENSLRNRGEGGWAHVAGMALAVGPDGHLARLEVRRADGQVEAVTPASAKRYRAVVSTYVACGGDGYDLGVDLARFGGDARQCRSKIKEAVDRSGPEKELSAVVLAAIEAAGATGIAPAVDGRICEAGQTGCLIDR
jgi:2',3'-cyclic-nucleotide 2'-phosphodiesterase (5'-nucleotidase family)